MHHWLRGMDAPESGLPVLSSLPSQTDSEFAPAELDM